MKAASEGDETSVQLLIEAGADVNTQSKWGNIAVVDAALEGHDKCVELLIKAGADVNKQDGCSSTALICAAGRGHTKCLELLVEAGADMNVQKDWGITALIKAARWGHDKCIGLLLEAGADVNIPDIYGNTAVMNAAYENHGKCVQMLFTHDAAVGRYHVPSCCKSDIGNEVKFKRLMMQLFSSGQELLGLDEEYTKEALLGTKLSLKSICREAIRNHLLQMSNVNLFVRVPRLGLPSILTDYLLYDQTLDDVAAETDESSE